MTKIAEWQLTGLLTQLRYAETPYSMRAILTDGTPSNVAEHIKKEFVCEITNVLESLDLEYEIISE